MAGVEKESSAAFGVLCSACRRRHELGYPPPAQEWRGCGAMYEIHIESEEFKEKKIVQQHQMINQALENEIKDMHGLRIFTSVPKR
ncbi:bolA-like protein 3 isoform X2 [Microcaecilia unicolor]|uniref:BolA-like protein 3 isoform X2 n=1 Tax=Microcaecilia unicolor TaxID=1415580 RepID=A0A6P7XYK5_9AMPH|nr:bolA-like protein 3 isoform X2 [Microcaecilia unicolor]